MPGKIPGKMPGDSLYQDLQFKDDNLYSVLDTPAVIHQKPPKVPQTSKDVGVDDGKRRKWKIAAIVMILISIVVVILAVAIFVTTCKKQDINTQELNLLKGRVCANGEMPCSYCAKNWLYFSGNCYFFSLNELNWTDSRAQCLSMQAQLAVIKTDEEETFVEATGHAEVWIGLSKNSAGELIFEDGTILTGRGFFKKPDEPNSLGGSENCIELFPSNYGNSTGWNDNQCQNFRRHLCKQSAFKLSA